MTAPSIYDWPAYLVAHGETCAVEGPWQAEVDWTGAPDGSRWFFVTGHGHSGSSAFTEVLSLHPAVWCGNEDNTPANLLGLFTTKTVISGGSRVLYWQNKQWSGRKRPFSSETRKVTAGYLRALCEVWRAHVAPGKAFVGDKHIQYLLRRDRFRKVFPGCRFVFCLRHPLDKLSGLLSDEWVGNAAIAQDPKAAFDIVNMALRNWQAVCREPDFLVVKFESFADPEILCGALATCYQHLGADPAAGPDPAALAPYCYPDPIGRWHKDDRIARLLDSWQQQALITKQQREALVAPPEHYADFLSAEEWNP